jgi:hypothetical protein
MRTLFLTLVFLFVCKSNAQNLTADQVDALTYDAYLKSDFTTIKEIGTKALHDNIDFYLLRYRLGIAYYNSHNYEKAAIHFEKAYATDATDMALAEYLYYSYLFSNQKASALVLAQKLPKELQDKIGYTTSIFESISLEAGMLKTNNYTAFKDKNIAAPYNNGQGTFYNDVQFANLTFISQLNPKLRWTNYVSYASNTYHELIQTTFPNTTTKDISDSSSYYQWNSLLQYTYNKWNIAIGAGGYYSGYITYTLAPPFPTPNLITTQKTTNSNYSGSITIGRHFQYIEPTIGFSYSNLSETKNYISEAGITYFPFGNLSFYGNTKIAMVSNEFENNTIYSQLIGLKLSKKIWLEGFGASGNHENYLSEGGILSFNTPNKINWYAGSNLNFYFKKVDFSLGYVLQQREGSYSNNLNPNTVQTNQFNYTYNLIKTKITWKF